MKKLVPFMYFFMIFAGSAAFRPYLALYFQSLSFSGAQIGLLVGIAPLLMIFTMPIITGLADATSRHRMIMNLLLVMVIAALLLMPHLSTFISILIVITIANVLFAPLMPLSNNATMFMLGKRKDLYGRIRLGGTIGFSIASLAVGALIENNGIRITFTIAAVLYIVTIFFGQKLEHCEKGMRQAPDWSQARLLLQNPHYIIFLLIGLASGISFMTIGTYLFPYMKELGASETTMAIALTVGTVAEIPILFFANRYIKHFSTYSVMIFSLVMMGLRFLLLAIAPNATFVLIVQLLNGFNYPLVLVASVTYTDEQAPDGFRATAQGLFEIMIGGLGAAIGGLVGGLLFDSVGPKGMYLIFAIFVISVVTVISLVRRLLLNEQKLVISVEPA